MTPLLNTAERCGRLLCRGILKRPGLNRTAKIVWSVVVLVLSIMFYQVTMKSVDTIKQYYELIEDL